MDESHEVVEGAGAEDDGGGGDGGGGGGGVVVLLEELELTGVETGGVGEVSQDVLVSGGGLATSVAGIVESQVVLVEVTTLLQSGKGISSSELTSMIL